MVGVDAEAMGEQTDPAFFLYCQILGGRTESASENETDAA
jgi:hypothetical protein